MSLNKESFLKFGSSDINWKNIAFIYLFIYLIILFIFMCVFFILIDSLLQISQTAQGRLSGCWTSTIYSTKRSHSHQLPYHM